MIFFIVTDVERGKSDNSRVISGKNLGRFTKNYKIIAWNEVYPTLDDMHKAIFQAAKGDPVCVDYLLRYEETYKATVDGEYEADLLSSWAHPMIGNLVCSPKVRPTLRSLQIAQNWTRCDFTDKTTRSAIARLLVKAPQLRTAARDQARICYNIVELARAFIGELTSRQGRRLEKLFALQACLDSEFHGALAGMLRAYMKMHRQRLMNFVRKRGVEGFEYARYYLPPDASDENVIPLDQAEHVADMLVALALDEKADVSKFESSGDVAARCVRAWRRLPPLIRCVALMNDLRKLDDRRSERMLDTGGKVSMCVPSIGEQIGKGKLGDVSYAVGFAAGLKHVPVFVGTGRDLTWSWNRDELHEATLTYRHFLCPLWAGASGHTAGNIQFWMHVLGEEFPAEGAVLIATGLFTLWRLYYDKRISGCHTLVETLEATFTSQVIGDDGYKKYSPEKVRGREKETALSLLYQCAWTGPMKRLAVDPIAVLETLRLSYCASPSALSGLPSAIDKLRGAVVSNGWWLPQWSKEFSMVTGTDVCSFARHETNTLSLTSSDSLSVSIGGPESSTEVAHPPTEVTVVCEAEHVQVSLPRDFGEQAGANFTLVSRTERGGCTFRTTRVPKGEKVVASISFGQPDHDDLELVVFAKVAEVELVGAATDHVVKL